MTEFILLTSKFQDFSASQIPESRDLFRYCLQHANSFTTAKKLWILKCLYQS